MSSREALAKLKLANPAVAEICERGIRDSEAQRKEVAVQRDPLERMFGVRAARRMHKEAELRVLGEPVED